MYPEVFSAKNIFKDNSFHLKLFDASVANYFELNNPIRFNNFCYSIRELLREKIESESPDDLIKKTTWYLKKETIPTKADKIRYYILKGLNDENIPDEIKDILNDCLDDYRKLNDILNKYTHINNKSFGIEFGDGDKWFRKSIKLLNTFIELIDKVKEEIQQSLKEEIQEDIEEKLFMAIPSEIDELSTHSSIDEVTDIEFDIENMNHELITIQGTCSVGVELVYGSDSDRRNDSGTEFSENYPMKFKIFININNLDDREYDFSRIDTSKFYE